MLLSNRVYDVLKKIAQVWLPAAGTLYFALAQIWHLPAAAAVVGTIVAVDAFLGVGLGLSTASFNKSEDKYDGTLAVEENEDGSTLRLQSVDPVALTTKNEITFKIDKQ